MQEKRQLLRSLPRLPPDEQELHVRKLSAVDISDSALDKAIHVTAPRSDELRWEELRVEIWKGSLAIYNDALDHEAFVASEVIEHVRPALPLPCRPNVDVFKVN